jgi:HPt (histidine-containing phosphotransfer) domain-containing protein
MNVKLKKIDKEIINQLNELNSEGMPDILIELIDSFVKTSLDKVKNILFFLQNNEIEKASREAHSLKSSAKALGCTLLGDLCQKVEDLNFNASLEVREKYAVELNTLYRESIEELIEIKKNRNTNRLN